MKGREAYCNSTGLAMRERSSYGGHEERRKCRINLKIMSGATLDQKSIKLNKKSRASS